MKTLFLAASVSCSIWTYGSTVGAQQFHTPEQCARFQQELEALPNTELSLTADVGGYLQQLRTADAAISAAEDNVQMSDVRRLTSAAVFPLRQAAQNVRSVVNSVRNPGRAALQTVLNSREVVATHGLTVEGLVNQHVSWLMRILGVASLSERQTRFAAELEDQRHQLRELRARFLQLQRAVLLLARSASRNLRQLPVIRNRLESTIRSGCRPVAPRWEVPTVEVRIAYH